MSSTKQVLIAKAEIDRLHDLVEAYKHVRLVFKSVGDALAYIYIPIWDIKPLAYKESPGFLSGKAGLRAELLLLRQLEEKGVIAILNDLTNDLRYGDITVVDGEGLYIMVEVKASSHKNKARELQRAKLDRMASYLWRGESEDIFSGSDYYIKRFAVQAPERWNTDALSAVISKAYEQGGADVVAEEGVVYFAAVGYGSGSLDTFKAAGNSLQKPMLHILNSTKYDNMGHMPYCLVIQDPEAAFDFFIGRLFIVVLLDVQVLMDKLAAHAIKVEVSNSEGYSLLITDLNNSDENTNASFLGPHLFGRLFMDFLSLDWFVHEVAHLTRDPQLISMLIPEADRSDGSESSLTSSL